MATTLQIIGEERTLTIAGTLTSSSNQEVPTSKATADYIESQLGVPAVPASAYPATDNTIIYGDGAGNYVAVDVAEARIVGRITGGNINDLTLSQVLDMVGSAANGDILFRSGGAWTRLPKGTDGDVLKMVSGLPAWVAP